MEQIPGLDLYRELEVDPTASRETIDAAWRSLVKRNHPDVARDSQAAEERIRRLNVAHDWLGDPDRRSRYDTHRLTGRYTGWRQSPPPSTGTAQPGDREPRPPSPPPTGRTPTPPAAGTPGPERVWIAAAGLVGAAVLAAIVVVAATTLPLQPAPVGGSESSVPATPRTVTPRPATPRPTPTLDSRGEARSLLALIPDRVGGLHLVGTSAGGDEIARQPGGESIAPIVDRLGRDRSEFAFAYKAAASADGTLLAVTALAVRGVTQADLLDAFMAHTQAAREGVTWTRTDLGGEQVWVSPDPDEPSVVAYAWAGGKGLFIVVSNDRALASAAIAAIP